MKSPFLQLSVLLLVLASPALAYTWYVNGLSGSDSNNCTAATTACKTIGHAIKLAASGDSISIAAATYTEDITISVNLNLVGANASTTIIHASPCSGPVVTIPRSTGSSLVVNISGVTVTGGFPSCAPGGGQGGGILNAGTLTLTETVVSGNTAGAGGGIDNTGTLTVNKSTISNNVAGNGGGIICGPGTMRIVNSTISGNSATGANAAGGGLFPSACPTTIINSTIAGNSAELNGGGIYSHAALSINSTTISGNKSLEEGPGGIEIYQGTKTTIQNSIIAGNANANCGILASGPGLVSNGYNISGDDTCNFDKAGDMKNTNPLLGPLQNNGGPTKTMAIKPGSLAIDTGNPHGCADGSGHLVGTDQRGDHRPGDPKLTTGCDIGAYEYQFPK